MGEKSQRAPRLADRLAGPAIKQLNQENKTPEARTPLIAKPPHSLPVNL
jgi:hypothetical protein